MLKITYAALKNPLACKTRGDDAREFFCADEYAAPGWAKKYTLNCTFANRVNEFAREDKLLGATFRD
jgi:hypothetical protein